MCLKADKYVYLGRGGVVIKRTYLGENKLLGQFVWNFIEKNKSNVNIHVTKNIFC